MGLFAFDRSKPPDPGVSSSPRSAVGAPSSPSGTRSGPKPFIERHPGSRTPHPEGPPGRVSRQMQSSGRARYSSKRGRPLPSRRGAAGLVAVSCSGRRAPPSKQATRSVVFRAFERRGRENSGRGGSSPERSLGLDDMARSRCREHDVVRSSRSHRLGDSTKRARARRFERRLHRGLRPPWWGSSEGRCSSRLPPPRRGR